MGVGVATACSAWGGMIIGLRIGLDDAGCLLGWI